MPGPIKTPEELLAYRPLKDLLVAKGTAVHAVAPHEPVVVALQRMAERGTGFLVVLEAARLVGVISERDYARKVALQGRSSRDTAVRDIMTSQVVTVTPRDTIPRCMALMDEHGFRHLPVVEDGNLHGVVGIRDVLRSLVERAWRDHDGDARETAQTLLARGQR